MARSCAFLSETKVKVLFDPKQKKVERSGSVTASFFRHNIGEGKSELMAREGKVQGKEDG